MRFCMPRFIAGVACLLWCSGTANSQQIFYPPEGGRITTSIDGYIKTSGPSPEIYRAGAGATNQKKNSLGSNIANDSSLIVFADPAPYRKLSAYWGGIVKLDTVGDRWTRDQKGVVSNFQSNPFVYGMSPLQASAGGALSVQLGPQMTGTPSGEVRFRTLDTSGVKLDFLPSSASNFVESGRAVYSGYLKWEPPYIPTSGYQVIQYATYMADLEVQLFYGHDGVIDGGQDVKWAMSRAVDLDVVTDPVNTYVDFSNFIGSGSFGYTFRDGDQAIRIRRQGGSPPKPLESGWTVNPAWPTSYVTLQNKRTGLLNTTKTVNWGNRTITSTPIKTEINTWQAEGPIFKIPNITLAPKASTVFEIKAVTSNWSSASRNASLGRTRFPADKSATPTFPCLGNGVEVRVRLKNLRKI